MTKDELYERLFNCLRRQARYPNGWKIRELESCVLAVFRECFNVAPWPKKK